MKGITNNNDMSHIRGSLKVLCISLWTPPTVRPQAILIGKMMPEWLKQGLDPTVIRFEGQGHWNIDVPLYEVPRQKNNRYLKGFTYYKLWNDSRYYEDLYGRIKKILDTNTFDLVFSYANPQVSNIVGALLKERLHIPFISHFSDTWVESPFRKNEGKEAQRRKELEEYIVTMSDRIVFIDESMRDVVMKKYPEKYRELTRIVRHCYVPEEYPDIVEKNDGTLTISHIGLFRKERTPEILFQAVRTIVHDEPSLRPTIKINLVGAKNSYGSYDERELLRMIDTYGLHDNVSLIPQVDFKKSLWYMKKADCLLALDSKVESTPWIISKVIDYAASGRPILGITNEDNATAKFIRSVGYKNFYYNELDAITDHLRNMIRGTDHSTFNDVPLKQYHVSSTTRSLINVFEEIVNTNV